MKSNDTCIFYRSFLNAINHIPDRNMQNEIIRSIVEYGLNSILPENINESGIMIFEIAQPLIDADRRKRNGGAPLGNQNAKKNKGKNNPKQPIETTVNSTVETIPLKTNKTNNVNVNENDNGNINKNINENVNKNENRQAANAATHPPTLEEVEAYCSEKGYSIDAEHFFSYYEANGWRQKGGTPIKNWKAAVTNWVKNESRFNTNTQKGSKEDEEYFKSIDEILSDIKRY